MKHNLKITAIILAMFLITQLIGIYVASYYAPVKFVGGEKIEVDAPDLPFGLEMEEPKENFEFAQAIASIIFAFIIAISLLLLLSRFKIEAIIRFWFFSVVAIGLGITFNVPFSKIFSSFSNEAVFGIPFIWASALALGLILSFFKIYRRGYLVHNFTELLIYPGIASVFIPILNVYTVSILLIVISIYDMWAVWHSGLMQKMAKYQIDNLNIFSGFFIPYFSKNLKAKIKKMKQSKTTKSKLARKIKVNVAVLGGGDVVFPIIVAGVMLKTLGLYSAILVSLGAMLGLTYLLFSSEKKKFYPAMPFISVGIFTGILVSYLVA